MGDSALKTCRICKVDKPVTDFYKRKRNKGGFRTECKNCHGKNGRQWYLHNKDQADTRLRKECLHRLYGLSVVDWDTLYKKQHGVCAICQQPETKFNNKSKGTQRLSVDHNHVTGKVRGLLCHRCNVVLGQVEDDCALVIHVLQYLEAR